jgi:Ca2+-binding RTX toxin-like protein
MPEMITGLEPRFLLAAVPADAGPAPTMVVQNQALIITGAVVNGVGFSDTIDITQDSLNINVTANGNAPVSFQLTSINRIVVHAGPGDDSVRLTPADGVDVVQLPASLQGGNGNDTLIGGAGNDTIAGNAGADWLAGSMGNDSLMGGDGNDRLFGGMIREDLLPGGGVEVPYAGSDGDDTMLGGNGKDFVDYSLRTDDLVLEMNGQPISGDATEEDLIGKDVERLLSGSGNDSVVGNALDNFIVGGPGNDTVYGLGGNDHLIGDNGNDQLFGGAGNDTLRGGAGRNKLRGGLGDNVYGNPQGGTDTITGSVGLNFVQVANGNTSLSDITEVLDPTPPTGAALPASPLDTTTTTEPSPTDLAGLTPLDIEGTTGDDSITVSSDASGSLTVNNDGVITQPGNIIAFSGIIVRSHAGNDTISAAGVPLPVVLNGAGGNDSLQGSAGPSALIGGGGDDTLVGGSSENLLIPAALSFTSAPNGNDLLIGGPAGSDNYADFTRRTDPSLLLTNDGQPHDGTTIMPSVQNILAGTGADTVIATVAGGLLNAGIGQDSLVSGGAGSTLQAGPVGAGSDTVVANGGENQLLLANSHADTYSLSPEGGDLPPAIDDGLDVQVG